MPKDDRLYIPHILQAAEEALGFSQGVSKEDFISNRMMALAVIRLLQEIGETAAHVSPSFRELHQEIPWRKMISMRNFLVHHYLKIDYDVVWETVEMDLPELVGILKKFTDDA